MKNNKNLKIKILLSLIILVILSAVTYISLPYISYALENAVDNFLENVGKITNPANVVTMNKEQIHEHRGWTVVANYSATEAETYEQAVGKTGISDINSYIKKYMSPSTGDCAIGSEPLLGWVGSLCYNTSIFCQESGIPFPGLNARVFNGFHAQQNTNRNEEKDIIQDFVEWCPPLACEKQITIYLEDYKDDGIELRESKMSEADIYYATGFKWVLGDFEVFTSTRVDYTASPRNFDTVESYIFTYSLRNYHRHNPAQVALWKYKNNKEDGYALEQGLKLYRAAKAIDELKNPTKPQMSVTTTNDSLAYSTGTVLDGNNYKVGPIKMNGYSYGWTEDVKDFSGQSSLDNPKNAPILANKTEEQKEFFKGLVAGIIEAKLVLDNGEEIILDKDNFKVEGGSTNSGSSFYSYPTMEQGYEYPTPNSNFYIILPISECVGATKIEKVTMTYKWHTADGNGGDLDGYYYELKWTSSGTMSLNEDTTYHCDNSYGGYACVHDKLSPDERSCYYGYGWDDYNVNQNAHDFWCGKEGYCFDGRNVSHRHCEYGGSKWGAYTGEQCVDCPGHQGSAKHSVCTSAHHTSSCKHSHTASCYHSHGPSCYSTVGNTTKKTCTLSTSTARCGYSTSDYDCGISQHSHKSTCCTGHDSWYGPNNSGCYNTDYCGYADLDHCIHGHQDGEHSAATCQGWGIDHIHECYGPEGEGTRCNAHPDADGGGHRNCATFDWKCMKKTPVDVQKLMYVTDAQVYEHNEECYIENIPLVAKVEIDKYIYDVEHAKTVAGVVDDTFGPSDDRRQLEETDKEGNPVYVESDDYVTYKIIMKNSSAFGVKIRVDDILPDASSYKFISANVGGTAITNLNELREKIITINATSEASITVTLQVKALEGIYENRARIITRNGTPKNTTDDIDYIRTVDDDGPVVNHIETTCNGTTEAPEWESSDWFILNNYNVFIDKYLYKYDEKMQNENNDVLLVTNESSIVNGDDTLKESRLNTDKTTKTVSDGNLEDKIRVANEEHEKDKANHPVNVEKYENVTYAIRVYNDASLVKNTHESGNKTPTKLKVTNIEDKLHNGLQYTSITATIFNSDGSKKVANVLGVGCTPAGTEGEYNIYNITTSSTTVIEPGEYIEFYMEAEVIQSNMYLYEMKNSAKIKQISNINDIDVTTRNISEQKEVTEYVRMKDLVISGRVWVDFDRNGLMDDYASNELDKINNNINDDAMKEDVIVRLYRVGAPNNPIRTTKTDENGLYTFGRNENLTWYDTYNNTIDYSKDTKYQRIDKASNKDEASGNYTSASEYYQYYVEFVYDGVVYKSTEVYSDMSNLTGDGKYNEKYPIDSNAAEFVSEREDFNTKYEYISYNVAYDLNNNKNNGGDLVFQKDGHESYLMENDAREITAKSFIDIGTEKIKYLWLYPFNSGVNRTTPETEYLKYINLGLELREDVDLALSKDIYSVKTTINGEEMEYDYNLGETLEYTNPYIISKPYGFEVYEADYKYRVEQYISQAVEQFKGNGADELNIEVTYRINLKNMNTPDEEGGSENTPLDVKVHEVLDLYDENFMDVTSAPVTAMVKDNNGKLIPKQIETVEAWMFIPVSEAEGKELLDSEKTYSRRNSEVDGGKATYVLDKSTNKDLFVKAKLDVSATTDGYSTKKDNNFATDGYKTAYITGMGDIIIPEGKAIDIYVKYIVDKAELEIDVGENYEETQTAEVRMFDKETKTSSIEIKENENMTTIISETRTITRVVEGEEKIVKVADLKRSIKLADRIEGQIVDKGAVGRGTENIAQINAYSVWYTNGDPASLVDKDSNAGNIGIKNASEGKSPNGSGYSEAETSADDVTYYEDMTYKTGIEIVAEGTENTRDVITRIYEDRIEDEEITIFEITKEPLTRRITGTVWDDSRSTTMGNEAANKETAQYIGNGMYNPGGDGKIEQAKSNDNVKLNYKEDHVTEDTDIAVRNAKAEFVEIVNVDGRYYEETLTHITWKQKQTARTEADGTYELYGLVPGTYVVRFTYGDYIDIPDDLSGLSEEQKDMLIFNGQDYKSTQYTGADESLDAYKDADKIIVEFNDEHESDARDDEIRRLEVNNYSEVMTNEVAEILKGLANGTKLTPHSSANDASELKALAENTYMIADTREFLVKPEKLLDDSQKPAYAGEYMYSDSSPFYKHFTSMKNKHIEDRYFDIKNVDFGIEYRPESEISLMKEIVQLTLITEDNETLVDLHFETKNVGNKITHEINKEKSIGYDLVQFITNDYTPKSLINNIVSEEYVQGLAYIQVDEEILQGCTVKITYGFNAQNCSEVDRISTNLNNIRYKYNKATQELIKEYINTYSTTKELAMIDLNNIANDSKYTATALAKAVVFADTYNVDEEDIVYREIPKQLTTDGKDGYYGRYVGYGYYTGDLSNLDTISSLKFDKILDYIDTNLEYEQKTTSEEVIDRLWYKITSRELISLVSHYKGLRQNVSGMTDEELPKVTDIDGVEYKSMVVSVDDRNVDPKDPNEKDDRANSIKNKDLSRFLIPKVTAVGLNGNDDIGKENDKKDTDEHNELGYNDYTGHIYLDVSKVLAAGSDDDDKTYENMAEIVQFTTLNGRRTNFATTIGNANIHDIKERLDEGLPPFEDTSGKNSGSIEFITASIEPDTSATETITLIPPTGLMKNRRAIVSIMETAKAGVEVMSMTGLVVAIVAGIAFLVILAIRKYKKRRIK